MKFMLIVYNESKALEEMPSHEFDSRMRQCLDHADELRDGGKLLESRMLDDVHTAKSVRIRNGRRAVLDGPFTETKEVLGGFNLIEAADMDEAVRMAAEFPWAETGCIEVRPVRDIDLVRARVTANVGAVGSHPE